MCISCLLFVVHVRTKGFGKVWLKRYATNNPKEYYGIFLERYVSALMVEALNSPTSNCLACSTSCSLTWNNSSLVIPKIQLGYPNKSSWVVPKVVAVAYGRGLLRESRFKRGFTKVVVTRAGRLRELLHGELQLYFVSFCPIFYF